MKDIMTKLLYETKEILKEQEKYLKASGEDFNIFSVTKIERYENNTHSAMLAELLNPEGSHHQRNLFLQEFILQIYAVVPIEFLGNISMEEILMGNPNVIKEKSNGTVDLETATGGRIDILVKTNKIDIIIENKIDARDQNSQLLRYYNDRNKNKTTLILYLTLNGDNPSLDSARDLIVNKQYFNISYKRFIVKWLEKSMEQISNEYVNHAIKQYLNLVKKITFQLENKHMENLKTLLKMNLEEANQIAQTLPTVINTLQVDFRNKFKSELSKILPKNLKIDKSINDGNIYIIGHSYSNHALCFAVMFTNEPIYYGLYNHCGSPENNTLVHNNVINIPHQTINFPFWDWLKDDNHGKINLNEISFLSDLKDSKKEEKIISLAVKKVGSFIEKYEYLLS